MVRLVVGWLLTAALIVVVTAIFYGILNAKEKAVEKELLEIVANPESP